MSPNNSYESTTLALRKAKHTTRSSRVYNVNTAVLVCQGNFHRKRPDFDEKMTKSQAAIDKNQNVEDCRVVLAGSSQ